jgi:hypothetical protein
MSKHTQGPWGFHYSNDVGPDDDYFIEFFEVVNPLGDVIARVDEEPDASLIAAAPDLLDALVEVMLRHVPFSNKEAYAEKAREAIAKATGENK